MCTYSIPIKDKASRVAGVLFADITMEDATIMFSSINSGIQRSGLIIFSHPVAQHAINGLHHLACRQRLAPLQGAVR